MGLLKKLFGGRDGARPSEADDDESALRQESEATTEMSSRNAPRREVVQVVLRDTMRKHGIPSDWIECRILSVSSATRGAGMHVLLVVREGEDRLVTYVHAFQDSFMRELVLMEPRAVDWVFSLSWQFEGNTKSQHARMPDPASWSGAAAAGPLAGKTPAQPQPQAQDADEQEALQSDLAALYAIRDAVLRQPVHVDGPEDFQPTQPGGDDDDDATRPR